MRATGDEQDAMARDTSPAGIGAAPRLSWVAVVLLLLVVAVMTVVVVGGLESRRSNQAALKAETRDLAVPTVATVFPAPGKAGGGLLLSAEVKPWAETPIYARASGYVKQWHVNLGERVTTGQLLAEIEAPELDQQLESARYQLAQAEAALALSKVSAQRASTLGSDGTISRQENDEKQADLELKTAMVNASRADVSRLEKLLSFTRITAPFAGVITGREADVGNLIAMGGEPKELFRLAQTDRLRVFVHVPQSRSSSVVPGMSVEMLVPEMPGKVFPAVVSRTAGAIAPESRTLLTELEVDNNGGMILAGSYAQVRFPEKKAGASRLTLPGNTLLFRAEGPQVGVVRSDGKVELRGVRLGRDLGQNVEILGG